MDPSQESGARGGEERRCMTAEEAKQYKAKQLRYKKPIARDMNLSFIQESIWNMGELITDVQWFVEDQENLVNALNGDEDEAYAFRMAFSDLAAELEQFEQDLNNEYIPDCFDDLFPAVGADFFGGFLGYDSYEGDYFGLQPSEYKWAEQEAEKRICHLTKKELLDAVGACLRVYTAYVALQYRYDCLEASLKIIQEKNLEGLKLVKAIEDQYDKAEADSDHFKWKYGKEVAKLDEMLNQIPQEYWL